LPPPNVLITRPVAVTEGLAEAVRQRGYHPLVDPLMEIVPIAFTLPAAPYDAIFITSANAVRPMAQVCDTRTPVLTVGQATCEAARTAGFTLANCIGQTVAEALQSLTDGSFGRLLYLSGTHVTTDLAGQGFAVTRVPVYDTRFLGLEKNTIDLLYSGDIAWILLFSRRSAEAFSMAVAKGVQQGWLAHTGAVCLSERTAQPVRAVAWNRLIVAAQPTAAAMIAALPGIA
jgi:uroporphyrinogen-III synthase